MSSESATLRGAASAKLVWGSGKRLVSFWADCPLLGKRCAMKVGFHSFDDCRNTDGTVPLIPPQVKGMKRRILSGTRHSGQLPYC